MYSLHPLKYYWHMKQLFAPKRITDLLQDIKFMKEEVVMKIQMRRLDFSDELMGASSDTFNNKLRQFRN